MIFNYLCTGHLHRHVIFNYTKVTINCLFTIGKGIKCINNIFCVNAALKSYFNIYRIRSIILN